MRIHGLDFTSTPTPLPSKAARQKRLMRADCRLAGSTLIVDGFQPLNGPKSDPFAPLDEWLRSPGPWVAGLDFPFGQPAELVAALGWPSTWDGYVQKIGHDGKATFVDAIKVFMDARPSGRKQLFRPADVRSKAVSPMQLDYVPVGKMFFEGAPRLQRSPASIPPVRPVAGETRVALEAYPALVSRKVLGRRPYKNDLPAKATDALKTARRDLVAALRGEAPGLAEVYGLTVALGDADAELCVADASGDHLDSVLCALQAAWAQARHASNYGIPADASPLEGWIVDPEVCGEAPSS